MLVALFHHHQSYMLGCKKKKKKKNLSGLVSAWETGTYLLYTRIRYL